jgi:hypothetical protein
MGPRLAADLPDFRRFSGHRDSQGTGNLTGSFKKIDVIAF